MSKSQPSILKKFDESVELYDAFRISAETALRELIRLDGMRVHSISSRTKARESFCEKLGRDGKDAYEQLGDVTDIVGIRIITYIEDEVDRIGELIRREFLIDAENSIDKRKVLDPDRFGYLSLHFVAGFSSDRTAIAENRRFSGLKFEIQARSILQHAWAEIEHDLGYKVGSTVPATVRRRFSRLAGLLEIADEEFRRLRDELNAYEVDVPKKIKVSPDLVALDEVSLASFIDTSKVLADLDLRMAKAIGSTISDVKFDQLATVLNYFGVATIDELSSRLQEYGDVIVEQWKARVIPRRLELSIRRGMALFHLWQILAVLKGGEEELRRGFELRGVNVTMVEDVTAVISTALKNHDQGASKSRPAASSKTRASSASRGSLVGQRRPGNPHKAG